MGLPLYCICDGSDDDHTVILGVLATDTTLERTLVLEQGCFPSDYKNFSMDYMKKKHIRNGNMANPHVSIN